MLDEINAPGFLSADILSFHQQSVLSLLECDFLLLEADPGVSEADLFPRQKLLSVRRVRKLSNMRKPHVPHSSMAAIFRVIKFIHHVY